VSKIGPSPEAVESRRLCATAENSPPTSVVGADRGGWGSDSRSCATAELFHAAAVVQDHAVTLRAGTRSILLSCVSRKSLPSRRARLRSARDMGTHHWRGWAIFCRRFATQNLAESHGGNHGMRQGKLLVGRIALCVNGA
jgi:hypothetical protein